MRFAIQFLPLLDAGNVIVSDFCALTCSRHTEARYARIEERLRSNAHAATLAVFALLR
ncbi:hypothetical protein [Paraburkholderia dilworthii]|uniref:Uncharacterized protein n=1 Tax=Paraburkholderia dilworthii TaxID=948106 RepID=A0ABW9CYA3_9BURK